MVVMPFQSEPVVPRMMLYCSVPLLHLLQLGIKERRVCVSWKRGSKKMYAKDDEVLSLLLFLLIWGCHTRTLAWLR